MQPEDPAPAAVSAKPNVPEEEPKMEAAGIQSNSQKSKKGTGSRTAKEAKAKDAADSGSAINPKKDADGTGSGGAEGAADEKPKSDKSKAELKQSTGPERVSDLSSFL